MYRPPALSETLLVVSVSFLGDGITGPAALLDEAVNFKMDDLPSSPHLTLTSIVLPSWGESQSHAR